MKTKLEDINTIINTLLKENMDQVREIELDDENELMIQLLLIRIDKAIKYLDKLESFDGSNYGSYSIYNQEKKDILDILRGIK